MTSALPLAPFLLPLGFALLLLAPLRRGQRAALHVTGAALTLVSGLALLWATGSGAVLTAALGGWAAPYGIVLVGDRLSALMSVLAGSAALLTAWQQAATPDPAREKYFLLPLTQMLFAGVQLSFLTGDLFNLFVAFEVMLVASYALSVLGSTREQLREGFRYIVMNLSASALLVVACGLTYGVLGTLNMAQLAGRGAALSAGTAGATGTITAVALLLLLVFAAKSALFPLGFWLPGTYPALPGALGAFFAAVLTKVGVYALLRMFTTVFPQAEVSGTVLLALGSVSMLAGALGMVSQREWRRILAFSVVASVGYLALGVGVGGRAALGATLFYLTVSVLNTLALFLIAGVAERRSGTRAVRSPGMLERTPLLAGAFLLCALTLAGLPPTGGFIAKFGLVRAALARGDALAVTGAVCALVASLLILYALLNIWRTFFWGRRPARLPVHPVPLAARLPAGVAALLVALCALLAGPLYALSGAAAGQLTQPGVYIRGVLGEPASAPASSHTPGTRPADVNGDTGGGHP